ncbi:uncharacterized protein TNCT_449091 [Trichonephila clavata]|uniref:Uncharacterized protein n=1 Tax=Trichonephila clavata TaxID=2740835 RepID=A0A8X6GJY8_TRICU|nr:uncharacterized protein TNCT_449091 [Trichonephila clavata]
MLLQLKFPSTMIINGPSQSGKTYLVRKLISEQVFEVPIKKVVWCYKMFQPWFHEEKNIKFIAGLPTEDEKFDLLIIDDLMNSLTNDVAQIFTVGSHHKNFSVILITQNLFPRIRVARDISLNAHYIILFRNNRDQSQIACFGRQVFPNRSKFFMDAYKKATAEKYQFLLVDCFPTTDEELRLRQSLFPDERGLNWVFRAGIKNKKNESN